MLMDNGYIQWHYPKKKKETKKAKCNQVCVLSFCIHWILLSLIREHILLDMVHSALRLLHKFTHFVKLGKLINKIRAMYMRNR